MRTQPKRRRNSIESAEQLAQIFRADLFAQAQELRIATLPHETDSETRLLTA